MNFNFIDIVEKYGPTLLNTVLILVIGYVLSKLILSITKRAIQKTRLDPVCHKFILSVLKVTLYTLVVIIASSNYVNTSSLVAALSVVGVAVSLAVKDSLSNVAGGFILLFTKPFKVGDFVEIDGLSGSVQSITILQTKLLSFDNKALFIPNGQVSSAKITNYSAEETRLLAIPFSIAYEADLLKAKAILKHIVETEELALLEPAPQIVVTEHADSAIKISVRVWVKTGDYWTLNFRLLERVKLEFDKDGICIPFNQLDIHIVKDSEK